ncbi:DUF2752 domain-containing protein [Proteinivorax tanatarense]|uniref:DUF2752 domain-containing protein n=1 Tax=Proteinivorax tanatarense TaxID=1260629 RepID=A0AAU7VN23_9FIRM
MLDLWPRSLLKIIPVDEKRYFCYVMTAICLALTGILYNSLLWQQSYILSRGHFFISELREIVHYGRCPLCGGTRSFLSFLSGDILMALHYNMFGLLLFAIIYFLLPFRIAIVLGVDNLLLKKVRTVDVWVEKHFLYLLFVIFSLQWALDYMGILVWKA